MVGYSVNKKGNIHDINVESSLNLKHYENEDDQGEEVDLDHIRSKYNLLSETSGDFVEFDRFAI